AGGAGGEEHQHQVVALGGVCRPGEGAAVHEVLLIEVVPALPAAAYQDLGCERGAVLLCQLHLMGHVAVSGAEDGADTGSIEAVGEIMLLEKVGGGYSNGAQLVEAQDGKPELVVA